MLKVKPRRQKRGMCGPAVLAMVAAYYGLEASEKTLARFSGCTPEKGVGAEGLLRAARTIGLRGSVRDNATLPGIRRYVIKRKVPVIVDWFSGDDGHYSVVVGIDHKAIHLQDPEIGKIRSLDLETFKRVWFDFPGKFLSSPKDLILRRMIVLTPR